MLLIVMKIFKVIIVGPEKSGKSILFNTLNGFNEVESKHSNHIDKYFPTIGVDFGSRILDLKNFDVVKLQFWDTSGKERFDDITSIYYQKINIVFLVFDITSPNFNETSINNWITKIKNFTEVPIFFIANKKNITILQENQIQNNHFVSSNFIYQKGVTKYFEINALNFDENIRNMLNTTVIYLLKINSIKSFSFAKCNQSEENLLTSSSDSSDKQSKNKLDGLINPLIDKPKKKRKFWNYFCSIC